MAHFTVKDPLSAPGRFISYIILAMKEKRFLAVSVIFLLYAAVFIPSYKIAFVESDVSLFSVTRKSDFEDYYVASRTIAEGADPYKIQAIKDVKKQFEWKDIGDPEKIKEFMKKIKGVGTYLYPPLTAFLLLPVSGLDYSTATVIFQTLSMFAYIAFLYLLYVYTGGSTNRNFFFSVLLSTLILYSFLNGNFLHGNILSYLLLLVGAGLFLSFREERYLNIVGGFLIGIAIVIKVTPIFFGLVLLGKKRFAAIIGIGSGVIVGLLLPALYTGFEENLVLLQNWYDLILGNYGKQGIIRPWANNQSFSAMIGKLFMPGSEAKQAAYGLPLFGEPFEMNAAKNHLLAVIARYVNIVFLASGILIAFFLLFKNFRKNHQLDLQAVRLVYLSTLLSLLTAGVSWYHAFGMLILPVFLRLDRHHKGEELLRGEKAGLYLLSFFGILHPLLGNPLRDGLAMYSVFTLFCTGIAAHTAYLLMREKNGI